MEDEYKDGDENQIDFDAGLTWDITRRLRGFATYQRSRKKLLNVADSYDGWDDSSELGWTALLLKEPSFLSSLSMVRKSSQGEEIGWQPSHTFNTYDTFDLSKTLKRALDAAYHVKKEQRLNEIAFTYGATLSRIGPDRTAKVACHSGAGGNVRLHEENG